MISTKLRLYFHGSIFATLAASYPQLSIARDHCGQIFIRDSRSVGQSEDTQNILALIQNLYQSRIIVMSDLERMAEALKRGELINPISASLAVAESQKNVYRQIFHAAIDGAEINFGQVANWINELKRRHEVDHNYRQVVNSETSSAFEKFQFVPVNRGRFGVANHKNEYSHEIVLTHRTEVTSTLITQQQWYDVMGDLPPSLVSKVGTGGSQNSVINSNEFYPDFPVTSITWWSAIFFANEVSKRYGLPESYDLSRVEEFEDVERKINNLTYIKDFELIRHLAAQGRLSAPITTSLPKLSSLVPRDIYSTSGFRLMTEAEYRHLLLVARCHFGSIYDTLWAGKLEMFANFEKESESSYCTPNAPFFVGAKLPFFINDAPIFDLFGNARTWLHEIGSRAPEMEQVQLNASGQAINPQAIYSIGPLVKVSADRLLVHNSNPGKPTGMVGKFPISAEWNIYEHPDIGLRLVRTLDPEIVKWDKR